MLAHPDLDAADRIAMGARDFDRVDRRHQSEIAAFADHDALGEAINTGERYVEVGDDADRRRLDHMLEKPGIVARTGAAGVDQRRAAATRQYQRIDAQRSTAPVDVGVKL